jgi:hypothetical protein
VVERIAASGPVVVGGEDAAIEDDDRDAMLAVIAQAVDVPPQVTAG